MNAFFLDDGHVTDAALAAMADAADAAVGDEVLAHVDGCETCLGRLGQAAERSAFVGATLAAHGPALSQEAPRLPWRWLLGATVAGAFGVVLSLQDVERSTFGLVQSSSVLTRSLPLALRGASGEAGALWTTITVACALLMLATSAWLVRRKTRAVG
ncbi:MAG: hypothetical protein HOO96_09005 [Polyangiaceae bacterium]|nr:hypothetical protein [Polyangiaceae bacterium]